MIRVFMVMILGLTNTITPSDDTYKSFVSGHLLTLVQSAGELDGHPEPPELDGGAVLLAGQEDAVRLDVSVDDVIVVTILEGLDKHKHVMILSKHEDTFCGLQCRVISN